MQEGGSSATTAVKQRALKVIWKADHQVPADVELLDAFRPIGQVIRVQTKDKCAAVLFASEESVPAAVAAAAAAAAAEECPWKNWDVRPMMDAAHATRDAGSGEPDTGVAVNQNNRESTPVEESMNEGNVLLPVDGVVARHTCANPPMCEVEQRYADISSPLSHLVGSGDNNVYGQTLSPLSSPEGLKPAKIVAAETPRAFLDDATCDGNERRDVSHGTIPRLGKGTVSGGEDDENDEAAPLQHELVSREQHPDQAQSCQDADSKSAVRVSAPTASLHPLVTEEIKSIAAGLPGEHPTTLGQKEDGVLGSVSRGTWTLEEQTKARDQSKRLALEVARLRSSLRTTASELNTERSIRVRLEDEWWKKMREWEEDRDCLVTSKQDAERASKSAEENIQRLVEEGKTREANFESERVTREAAQHQADSAMNGVVKAQDHLIQALRIELEMTSRARKGDQDDAREAKEQLRLYVFDFLHWRDRAKQLEAEMANRHHSRRRELSVKAPSPCGSPLTRQQHPQASQQTGDDCRVPSAMVEPNLASADNSGEHVESTPTGSENGEEKPSLSVPENYARYFDMATDEFASTQPSVTPSGTHIGRGRNRKHDAGAEAEMAAAAWSTRSAMASCSSSASSLAFFERSMKAQQEISFRLGRDLAKARADLESIYAGSRTKCGGAHCDVKTTGYGLLRAAKQERREVNEADGEGEGNNILHNTHDHPTNENNRQVGDMIPHSSRCVDQNIDGDDIAAKVVEGSHMARVLAALLGTQSAPGGTGTMGLPDSQPPPLRLSDYPPMLQAVFGQCPTGVPSPSASIGASGSGVTKGTEGSNVRPVDTSPCGAELAKKRQPWSSSCSPALGDENQKVRVSESGIEANEGRAFGCGEKAGVDESDNWHFATSNTAAGADRAEREARCREHEEVSRDIPQVLGDRETCSLGRAFLGYEPKSSLLKRWLAERSSPQSQTQTTPVVT